MARIIGTPRDDDLRGTSISNVLNGLTIFGCRRWASNGVIISMNSSGAVAVVNVLLCLDLSPACLDGLSQRRAIDIVRAGRSVNEFRSDQ
jgi:hypothetical protein